MNESRTTYRRLYRHDSQHQNNGSPPTFSSESWPIHSTDTRSGTGQKGWRKIIADGGDATTTFNGVKYSFEWEPGSATFVRRNGSFIHTATGSGYHGATYGQSFPELNPAIITASDVEAADNQAKVKLHKRIKEEQTRFSGMIFLGEARETLRMLRSPARSLAKGIEGYLSTLVKRRHRRGSRRERESANSRILADTWLEWSFGWSPLINDIKDAHEAYEEIMHDVQKTRVTAKGVVEKFVPAALATNGNMGPGIYTICNASSIKYEVVVRYIAGIRSRPQGAAPQPAIAQAGFTFREFIPTMWELLPWSFLIDYFTNIGDLLECAVTDTSGVTFLVKTVRKTATRECSGQIDIPRLKAAYGNDFIAASGFPGTAKFTTREVARTKVASVPFPNFRVELPGRKEQFYNMAALLVTRGKLQPYL